jgi:hypothetical protein
MLAAAILMITMGTRQTLGLFMSALNTSTDLGIGAIRFAMAGRELIWGVARNRYLGPWRTRWQQGPAVREACRFNRARGAIVPLRCLGLARCDILAHSPGLTTVDPNALRIFSGEPVAFAFFIAIGQTPHRA